MPIEEALLHEACAEAAAQSLYIFGFLKEPVLYKIYHLLQIATSGSNCTHAKPHRTPPMTPSHDQPSTGLPKLESHLRGFDKNVEIGSTKRVGGEIDWM